jgi:hypothetical protein
MDGNCGGLLFDNDEGNKRWKLPEGAWSGLSSDRAMRALRIPRAADRLGLSVSSSHFAYSS